MAQSKAATMKAEVNVIDELPTQGGVLVRAKAAKGHEEDARPIGGFFIRRRYAGDTFRINDWKQFSANWMEFVDEPPQAWLEAMKLDADKKAELMAKAQEEQRETPEQKLVFAMSQLMARTAGRSPDEFDHSSGRFKDRKGA